MNNAKEYVKTLTVSDLFDNDNKCNYIATHWEGHYAWGDNEINSLLQDIKNACKKNKEQDKNYYIGSLVVYRRENDGSPWTHFNRGRQNHFRSYLQSSGTIEIKSVYLRKQIKHKSLCK